SEIAGRLQHFGNRDTSIVQPSAVTWQQLTAFSGPFICHVSHAGLMRIKAGEQGSPGGTATCSVIELRKTHTIPGESIKVRCGDFPAITAEIGESHVIREDHDNVRLVRCVKIACSDHGKAADETGADDLRPGENGDDVHERIG